MGRKTGNRSNFRVVIEPRDVGDYGSIRVGRGAFGMYGYDEAGQKSYEKEMLGRCEEIAAQAKRHVDDAKYASVEFDTEMLCEFCGNVWTEKSTAYNGGCCEDDEQAEQNRQTAMAQRIGSLA